MNAYLRKHGYHRSRLYSILIGKTTLIRLCVLIAGCVLFSSCVRDGEDTESCRSNLRITFDWIETRPISGDEDVRINILPGNHDNFVITSKPSGRDMELPWDNYSFAAAEDAQNVTLDGRALILTLNEDGSATADISGLGDKDIVIPMRKQARKVVIAIDFTDDFAEKITKMSGTLNGIAISRDIDEGFPPADGKRRHTAIEGGYIKYDFAKEEIPRSSGQAYVSGRWLLGIDDSMRQDLAMRVEYQDGSSINFSLDISNMFSYVEDDIQKDYYLTETHTPWVIRLTLDTTTGLEVTISDWKAGGESWYTAS